MSLKSSSAVHGPLFRSISSSMLLFFKFLPFSSIDAHRKYPKKRETSAKKILRLTTFFLCGFREREREKERVWYFLELCVDREMMSFEWQEKERTCGFYRRGKMIVFNFSFNFLNYFEHVQRREYTAVM